MTATAVEDQASLGARVEAWFDANAPKRTDPVAIAVVVPPRAASPGVAISSCVRLLEVA